MLRIGRYVFKRAETCLEFEAIHRLNYRTFVDEIHQYPASDSGRLVDKFHDKNTYFISVRDDRVVGMISMHSQPPFSVAQRLHDPTILTQPGIRPMEVRLLAVEPDERNGIVLIGLLYAFYRHARDNDITDLFISGVTDRVPFYQRLGFQPLGPAVEAGGATFLPMSVTLPQLQIKIQRLLKLLQNRLRRDEVEVKAPRQAFDFPATNGQEEIEFETSQGNTVCLLPGPVTTTTAVRDAFHQPPIYHRGPEFIIQYENVRRLLGNLVGGKEVALCNGSGTLGNEAVAATLAATPNPGQGLMLVNGEFGQRLARQALRFGLKPRLLQWPWGQPWDLDEVEAALADEPPGSWVWGVHQESSTGILNDLPGLVLRARKHGIRVCVDCISSLGAVPLDLRDVYLATGATGKSLGAYAGISIIFADRKSLANVNLDRVPSYLDIAAALATKGPRYTFPSPVLLAVKAALNDYATPELAQARYNRYAAHGVWVRNELRKFGITPLADEAYASPVVTTFAPPGNESSETFVGRCHSWGFAIGGQSGYLAERRFVQIATMGAVTREACAPLFEHLQQWIRRTAPVVV